MEAVIKILINITMVNGIILANLLALHLTILFIKEWRN